MKLLSFDVWIHNNPDYEFDDCKNCEGDGYVWAQPENVTDEFADDFDACPECGSTGNAHFKEYELQINKDKKLLKTFIASKQHIA